MRKCLATLLVLAANLLAGCAREDPVTIQYKWEKGHVLQQRVTTESSTKTQMEGGSASLGGMNFDSTMTMTQDVRLRVLEVKPDGLATVEMTYTYGKMSMDGPMGSLSVDSREPAPADSKSPLASMVRVMKPMLDAYIGRPITFDIDSQGNIPRLTGMKAIADRISASGAPGAAGLGGALDDESMRHMLQQYYRGWQSTPLDVGDSWEVEQDMNIPTMGSLKSREKRTFKRVATTDGRRMATVIASFTLPAQTLGNKGRTRPPGVPEFDFTIPESKGTGEHIFDLDWGRLHRSTVTLEMPMEFPMPGGGQMKMTSTTKTTVEAVNQ